MGWFVHCPMIKTKSHRFETNERCTCRKDHGWTHSKRPKGGVYCAPQLCVCLFTINPCQSRFTQLGTLTPPSMESQWLDQTFWARKMDGLVVRLPNVWVHFHPIFWPIHMSPTLEGSMTWTAKIVVEPPSCAGYQKQSNKACLSTTLITETWQKWRSCSGSITTCSCILNGILTSNNCTAMNSHELCGVPFDSNRCAPCRTW